MSKELAALLDQCFQKVCNDFLAGKTISVKTLMALQEIAGVYNRMDSVRLRSEDLRAA